MEGMNMNHAGIGAGETAPRGPMMMHLTFFWGKNTEILFSGWPGYDNLGMYMFALVFIFVQALLVEWLSACKYIREIPNPVAAGLAQTSLYAVRTGMAYMLMLAVMSFNAGVFLIAVAGHAVGFFFFASRTFHSSPSSHWKTSNPDLPPTHC